MWPILFEIPIPKALQAFFQAALQLEPGEEITAIPIRAFGVMVMLGFIVGLWYAMRLAKKYGKDSQSDPQRIGDLAFWILLGIILGGRLLYVLVHPEQFSDNPLRILAFWQGGMVFYGGFIAAFLFGMWKCKQYQLDLWNTADLMLIGAMLGYGIGRWGCLLVGDDYGKITDVPWALHVPDPLPADSFFPAQLAGKYVHPTQLYMSLNGFFIAAIGRWMLAYRKFAGQICWSIIALYAIGRFIIEFFRGDDFERGFYMGLSTSQIIAIFTLGFASWQLISGFRKAKLLNERANG